ncbi:aspartate/glutamate racemase family protein [Salinispora oceanensis]|uniref:aspartate/glutamate racemase family protein n=1 Tax=Salinispora oceanensis TaxID=1050199 RepID=UPI000364DF9D|nr:aspartate/glutamate racemase family protein [Salinispora oceanensis]
MTTAGVGIVGGLGPLAGAHVYERFVRMSPAASDQEHGFVILISRPFPSRIAHLSGLAESPLPYLVDTVRSLQSMGCNVLALASATTHAYRRAIQQQTGAMIVDGMRATTQALTDRGATAAVVFCTRLTRQLRLYEESWPENVRLHYATEEEQRTIDELIDGVKGGRTGPVESAALHRLVHRYASVGITPILGCTELPLLWAPEEPTVEVVSVSDSIASAAIAAEADQRLELA